MFISFCCKTSYCFIILSTWWPQVNLSGVAEGDEATTNKMNNIKRQSNSKVHSMCGSLDKYYEIWAQEVREIRETIDLKIGILKSGFAWRKNTNNQHQTL